MTRARALALLGLPILGVAGTGLAVAPRGAKVALGIAADTTVPDSARRAPVRQDSTPRDSAVRDSLGRRAAGTPSDTTGSDLVKWIELDSVATSLLNRPGFRPTRYQGDSVVFDARTKALRIAGTPAAVKREQSVVVGDTVLYDDSAHTITALGDTVTIRDPAQQASDIVAHGRVAYDLARRRAQVTSVTTSFESGQRFFVSGQAGTYVGDTSSRRSATVYVRNGIITTCDDSVPDYYFKTKELKYVTRHLVVGRPATLYVSGVPVFWLPFIFQDTRSGRRSGILTPRFGVSDIVRNSPTYRRNLENLGYYVNLGNYMDALAWVDWRSAARATEFDPGFTRVSTEFRYNWIDRFLSGSFAASHTSQRNGSSNTVISLYHDQAFSQTNRLNARINYASNTMVQRNQATNPLAVLSTIRSDVRYARQIGPFALDLGGSRTQYPGRTQVEENYPTLSVSSPTLAVTRWLDWTPSLNYSRAATRRSDQVTLFSYRYFTNAAGRLDSTRVAGGSDNSSLSINTPFSIKGFQISASLGSQHTALNAPQTILLVDPADTSRRIERTFARTFADGVDWTVGFSLPSFLNNSLRVRPDVSFQNVDGGSYWVRTQLSRGEWVHQSKRVNTGISISPTFFGLFPGVGPLSRIRHSITASVRYGYSPRATAPAQYLLALNRDTSNYLGALAQNQLSLGMSQVFEAKLRSDTSASGEARKIKLLGLDFSPFTYDFERARATGRTGLTTTQFSYSATSDLLPGFTFRSEYSLFQGDINSDTARFKPFHTGLSANVTLNGQSGVFAALSRLFGRPVANTAPPTPQGGGAATDALTERYASLPVAGNRAANSRYQIPETSGWTTSLAFSLQRQRPPVGGRVVQFDPVTYCSQFRENPVVFDRCQQEAIRNPQTNAPVGSPIAGGVFVRVPPVETMRSESAFHITEKWSARWGTTYDFAHRAFASHEVGLQRDLHDWRAIFSYSSSPNGNTYFSVSIDNKAFPELRLPFNRATYRQSDLR